jgi:histone-lysine N-methyltransferase SETMAR
MKGPILKHYQEKEQTVNSKIYPAMLKDKLKPAHCNNREVQSKIVLLCHDHARRHVAAAIAKSIQHHKPEVLPNAPYSPDLTPSDFHAFGPLKSHYGGL